VIPDPISTLRHEPTQSKTEVYFNWRLSMVSLSMYSLLSSEYLRPKAILETDYYLFWENNKINN
jgi:hypothetical protein